MRRVWVIHPPVRYRLRFRMKRGTSYLRALPTRSGSRTEATPPAKCSIEVWDTQSGIGMLFFLTPTQKGGARVALSPSRCRMSLRPNYEKSGIWREFSLSICATSPRNPTSVKRQGIGDGRICENTCVPAIDGSLTTSTASSKLWCSARRIPGRSQLPPREKQRLTYASGISRKHSVRSRHRERKLQASPRAYLAGRDSDMRFWTCSE